MARVALVTRNALLAMGLTAAGHDVVEVRLSDADRWLAGGGVDDVSAVVLDLGDPGLALRAVARLRADGHWLPVLLVASHDPGWDDPVLYDLAGVDVLVLPISGPKLADAAARLLARKVVRPVDRVPVPVPDQAPADSTDDDPASGPAVGAVDDGPPAAPESPAPEHRSPTRLTLADRDDSADDLVQSMLLGLGSLTGVPRTATVIAEEAVRRVPCDAAAVIVSDGDRWRVSGGVGLLPLDRRSDLPAESWLVRQLCLADRAPVVLDITVARDALMGLPMAEKEHLVAASVPGVRAVILLGRDGGAGFDELELTALERLVQEAAAALQAALATRQLARSMHALEDPPA